MYQIGRQFAQRLRSWQDELQRHFFTPVAKWNPEFFLTHDRMTPAEAEQTAFSPCPEGTRWGGFREYGWFRGDITLPESCEGKRVILLGGIEGEQLYYVNGVATGSVDKQHTYITLTRSAKAGETFHVLCESYAGHGARLESSPPVPPERMAVPPCPEKQCTVKPSTVAIWNEDAYQLFLDTDTLAKLLQMLPDRSLRAMRVAKALKAYTDIADFELPYEERNATFRAAREALREVLGCHNGSTAPLLWLIGQSHIDLAWLWPEEETYHKVVRTFANQAALMEEYPEYQYLLCEPALMDMLRVMDQPLWQRIKDAYARGQIRPEGAFYVECDTNIPNGESLIRQLLWGRKWYQEHFGVSSEVGWLPDCFGFSGALPQIMKGCGVPCFATQKLLRVDPECEQFPYQHFLWEGIDGTTVQSLSFFRNNSSVDPIQFTERWEKQRVQNDDIDTFLFPFGHGDGGGGATRDMVEMTLRLKDLEGLPRSRYDGLREYFTAVFPDGTSSNRWVGEMYLAWHRGTYSSQRKTKALIRRAEFAIHAAEAAAAKLPAVTDEQKAVLHRLWERLLFDQFHDLAGGAGIRCVHEEAEKDLTRVIADANRLTADMYAALYASDESGQYAVNTLPWDRRVWLQQEDGSIAAAMLPADGAAPIRAVEIADTVSVSETADAVTLANNRILVTFDRSGCITQIVDVQTGSAFLADDQRMNDWRLYKNVQNVYDAWELSRDWEHQEVPGAVKSEITAVHTDPLCCRIEVTRTFSRSSARQVISLYADDPVLRFETDIDWQEKHRMLKTHFESNVLTEDAIHETQFGYVTRPAHRSTRFASDHYEGPNQRYSALCEGNRGFAVMNDGCFGISSNRGELALTLLRAPQVPDMLNNIGHHHLTYALYCFGTSIEQSNVARKALELNDAPVICTGTVDQAQQGFRTQSGNVLLSCVKPADDGSGIILRLFNSQRTTENGCLELPWAAKLYSCEMDESSNMPIGEGTAFTLRFEPFKIRTFRAVRI